MTMTGISGLFLVRSTLVPSLFFNRFHETRICARKNILTYSTSGESVTMTHVQTLKCCDIYYFDITFLGHPNSVGRWFWQQNHAFRFFVYCFRESVLTLQYSISLWEVNFSNSEFFNSDCRFGFLSKKYQHKLFLLFQNSDENTVKITKNRQNQG